MPIESGKRPESNRAADLSSVLQERRPRRYARTRPRVAERRRSRPKTRRLVARQRLGGGGGGVGGSGRKLLKCSGAKAVTCRSVAKRQFARWCCEFLAKHVRAMHRAFRPWSRFGAIVIREFCARYIVRHPAISLRRIINE